MTLMQMALEERRKAVDLIDRQMVDAIEGDKILERALAENARLREENVDAMNAALDRNGKLTPIERARFLSRHETLIDELRALTRGNVAERTRLLR